MRTTLGEAASYVLRSIRDAGIRATMDGGRLPALPAAVVQVASIEYDRLGDVMSVDWTVTIVSGDKTPTGALDDIGAAVRRLAEVFALGVIEPVIYSSPAHGGDLPAVQARISTQID